MNVNHELQAIAAEYKLYFPECLLLLLSGLAVAGDDPLARILRRKSPSHIRITTQEGRLLRVSVCVSGWHELETKQHYETFEGLMNTVSPAFRNTFASELTAKLNALS